MRWLTCPWIRRAGPYAVALPIATAVGLLLVWGLTCGG